MIRNLFFVGIACALFLFFGCGGVQQDENVLSSETSSQVEVSQLVFNASEADLNGTWVGVLHGREMLFMADENGVIQEVDSPLFISGFFTVNLSGGITGHIVFESDEYYLSGSFSQNKLMISGTSRDRTHGAGEWLFEYSSIL